MGAFTFLRGNGAGRLGYGSWRWPGLGFWFGRNEQLVLQNLQCVTLILAAGGGVIVFFYWRKWVSHTKRIQVSG